ncbi:MAG: T9SS type A sorting domain-containing protein, partial [Melioribacter sp.]|nr:T9SS type A sorting domain-containing protein [Melioribacter sp.]
GSYELRFDAGNMPSGVYFYKIQAGNFTQTKKMILMK